MKNELRKLLSDKLKELETLDAFDFVDVISYKEGQYDLIDEIITFLHEFEENITQ